MSKLSSAHHHVEADGYDTIGRIQLGDGGILASVGAQKTMGDSSLWVGIFRETFRR